MTFSWIRAALGTLLVLQLSLAADWPDFRGPHRDGVYEGADLVAEFPADGPPKGWSKEVGAGFSNPIVAGDKLILFHRVNNEEVVEALSPETGEAIWKHSYPTGYRDSFGFDEGPRASPVALGGQLYTFGAEGRLTCRQLATGKEIWSLDAHKEFNVRKGFFGAAGTPLVEGSRIFLNVGGADGAGVVALDKDTGRLLWKATDHEAGYSSLVWAEIAGKPRVVAFTREGILLLDPKTGAVDYEKRWRSISDASVNAAMPVVVGDRLFFTASYGTGAIALDFSTVPPRELWSGEESLASHYATPVAYEGVLYGYDGRQEYGQSFRAVDAATGRVLWTQPGMGAGTVSRAGDLLILLKEDGELMTVRANPSKFDVVSRARILPRVVRAYPAIADGKLYARNETTLVCIDLRGGSR